MKKLIIALILLVLTVCLLCPVAAEITMPVYYVNDALYDGYVLRGNAVVPKAGVYFARITFVFDTHFVTAAVPIMSNGDFELHIALPYDGYSVEITDRDSVAPPFTTFAWFYYVT